MLRLNSRQGNEIGRLASLRREVLLHVALISLIFSPLSSAYSATFDTHIDSTIYKLATEHNDRSAQYLLGKKYLLGKSVKQNIPEAIKWLELAATQNHKKAQYSLGKMYLYGEGVAPNYIYALGYLSKAANANHVGAQFELGNYYIMGVVGPKNYTKAVKWYREAVDRQHAGAMAVLGKILYQGRGGIKKQTIEGRQLLQLASDTGEIEAIKFLQQLSTNDSVDSGVSAPQPTLSDLELKAQQGDATAQYELGKAYLNGNMVRRDAKTAAKWFRKAANKDHVEAQYQLSTMYRDGIGIDKDSGKASHWLKIAAKSGHRLALRESSVTTDSTAGDTVGRAASGIAGGVAAGITNDNPMRNRPAQSTARRDNSVNEKASKPEIVTSLNPGLSDSNFTTSAIGRASNRPSSNPVVIQPSSPGDSLSIPNTTPSRDMTGFTDPSPSGPATPDAQFALGMNHLNGIGVERNRNLAVSWLEKAADQNYSRAQFALGNMYYSGEHFPVNITKAKSWLIKAADNGHSEANLLLQDILEADGSIETIKVKKVKKETSAKIRIASLAAAADKAMIELGNPAATTKTKAEPMIQAATLEPDFPSNSKSNTTAGIGKATFEPEPAIQTTVRPAKPKAAPTQVAFKTSTTTAMPATANTIPPFVPESDLNRAKRGDIQSQYKVGMMYLLGKGKRSREDKQQGLDWLRQAADNDHLDAQIKLAELFYKGDKVARNLSQAAIWYEKAAQTGNIDAQYSIGNMYKEGQGVPKNNSLAIKWLRKAANQGHNLAQKSLGGCRIC